jgi:signal transduction histidine kinase
MQEAGAGRGTGTGPRRRSIVAWTIAVVSIALIGSSFAIKLAYGTVFGAEDTALIVPGLLGGTAFAVVGALIAARTGNAVGWVFLGIAASFAVSAPAQNWVDAAIELGRPLAFVGLANWLSQWPFFICLCLFPAVFFLYPTGSLPSPRWRVPWHIYLGSLVVTVVGFALLPYRWDGIPGEIVTNPVGVEPLEPVLGVFLAVAGVTLVLSAFVALASLIVRARGSGPDEHQQIRWLGMVGRVGGVLFLLLLVAGFSSGDRGTGFAASATNLLMALLVITIVVGIPAATATAIFRFRLYDLDLVIRKTVIFAVLVAMLLAIGGIAAVGIVFPLVPSLYETPPLMLLLGLTYGLLSIPLYRLAKRIADRVVFGGRASPYEVLTEFSERVGETYASEDVLPRMAAVLGEGTGADTATVWLLVADRMHPAATWPLDADPPRSVPPDAVEVRHRGDVLGALSVSLPASDPMNPSKSRLLEDLASQAGLVLRNVRLIEELRASRQRLVDAQDEERRRLERNIHDGVQQQLVALNVQLGLLARMASTDPPRAAEMATDLQARATSTLDDLRDLARGIYPPLLADRGLATAVEAQARRAVVPTTVRADGLGRYPQEVEAAVYFSVLEAMNNVAKYAEATSADVSLAQRNGSLEFTVHDDGLGFDPANVALGSGLQGMTDRIDAIGGSLSIESEPGAGTTVRGSVPV